jgi:Rrf2 family iron-sulfur cluster assembly transcriptional regulator
MLLSKTCNYALRAALYVASINDREYIPINEISRNLNISFHFLTKILQTLTETGIMISFRGPNGGIKLTKHPQHISLYEIILAIDGAKIFEKCVLGLDECHNSAPCPLHEQWQNIRENLKKVFQKNTLETLTQEMLLKNFRISNLPYYSM